MKIKKAVFMRPTFGVLRAALVSLAAASVLVLYSAADAQRGDSHSVRILYAPTDCKDEYIPVEPGFPLGGFTYQGKTWFTDWEAIPQGTHATRKTYESNVGEYLISTDHTKRWNQARLTQSCWDERWFNTLTYHTWYYTSYTGRVYGGQVVDIQGEDEQAMCPNGSYVADPSLCGGGPGGGGGGGGGGSSPPPWGQYYICHFTYWSDGSTTIDYCVGPYDY